MKGFRSPILGALLALACVPGMTSEAERHGRIEALVYGSLKWLPLDQQAAALPLLQADVRSAGDLWEQENAARVLADAVSEWANTGLPVVVRCQTTGAGPWVACLRFHGPGKYSAALTRREPPEEHTLGDMLTHAAAWEAAVDLARKLQARSWAEMKAAQEFRPHPSLPGRLADGTLVVYDDLVTQPPTPEQRAKMSAWFDDVLGRQQARATVGVDLAAPEVLSTIRDDAGRALAHVALPAGRPLTIDDMRRAAAELEKHAIKPDADGFYSMADIVGTVGVDLAETDFQRAQRLAMSTPADRARIGPVDFKRAGEASRASRPPLYRSSSVLSACTCGGAGICSESCAEEIRSGRMQHPDGPCALGFEGRCRRCRRATHAAERAQRPARRTEQRIRKAGRTAAKKRRGWA